MITFLWVFFFFTYVYLCVVVLLCCSLQFVWFNTINFSQLLECKIRLVHELDWLEPLMFLLQNSPNLKVLSIDKVCTFLHAVLME